jgi:hypothetical protein
MSYARQLLDTCPGTDLSEQNVTEMITHIRLCLDCADVCTASIG